MYLVWSCLQRISRLVFQWDISCSSPWEKWSLILPYTSNPRKVFFKHFHSDSRCCRGRRSSTGSFLVRLNTKARRVGSPHLAGDWTTSSFERRPHHCWRCWRKSPPWIVVEVAVYKSNWRSRFPEALRSWGRGLRRKKRIKACYMSCSNIRWRLLLLLWPSLRKKRRQKKRLWS